MRYPSTSATTTFVTRSAPEDALLLPSFAPVQVASMLKSGDQETSLVAKSGFTTSELPPPPTTPPAPTTPPDSP